MKTSKIICVAFLAFMFGLSSCEQEERGPLVADSTSPEAISEVEVENLPGGAKISYKVPADEDALMVEVSYKRGDMDVTAKSSIYKNYVTIEGLRGEIPQEVQLVTIDKGNNRSQPVSVTITPLMSPIDKLFASFQLVEDFGGVRIIYDNEDKLTAELLLYAEDENGNLIYSQSAFINNNTSDHFTFRGYPPVATKFGIKALDRWNNGTETLEAELLPMEEVKLDRLLFKDVVLTGDEPDAWGWKKPNLWNNNLGGAGFHTAQGKPGTVVSPYAEGYHMFTVDLGVTARLSRFKFWQRTGAYTYAHGNPRYFEVWGIDKLPADNGVSLEGWTKLVENGEVIKPSGAPLNQNSAEDNAAAAAGHEFEFPIDAPPVRYIRFVNKKSWSGEKYLHIMELNFWGQK